MRISGGDEFALVIWDSGPPRVPNSQHPRSPMVLMERFRRLLKEHRFSRLGNQAQGVLTISGGLATFPWGAGTVQELIERADEGLLEAKRSGKDRIYVLGSNPGSNQAAQARRRSPAVDDSKSIL